MVTRTACGSGGIRASRELRARAANGAGVGWLPWRGAARAVIAKRFFPSLLPPRLLLVPQRLFVKLSLYLVKRQPELVALRTMRPFLVGQGTLAGRGG